jgi:hypothetical protein
MLVSLQEKLLIVYAWTDLLFHTIMPVVAFADWLIDPGQSGAVKLQWPHISPPLNAAPS